ncbi:Rieske 2Fe-2S domain-containing protein [Runella sp. CRIBMP]|uniref:Rieske 2Fe-2S domain-containing protein n=1 Tax=Runella sp. CRIBMP TaxID=2683261 RepID=UPI001412BCDF|nr:Rieske 2Fe-2S domain-containing protein [Runella sp. CRIBMP]NBB18011.1 Rieske 2Fe-2S domain-containing protein [Runella sp. CRIBMP]
MSYSENTWWPLGFERDFKANQPCPVSSRFGALVIYKTNNQWAGFKDICPHRGAPLSQGWVQNGELVCPYHGWCFNNKGKNTFVPVINKATDAALECISLRIEGGIVWASASENAPFPAISAQTQDIILGGNTTANLLNTLENFLEGSHTHYVHNGFIRSENTKRTPLKARLFPKPNGFMVVYEAEPAKGLLTKLLPKNYQLLTPTAHYIYPNIAILEYLTQDQQPLIRIEACLNESKAGCTYAARVFLRRPWLRFLGKWVVKKLFGIIIHQDKRILEMQKNNLDNFPQRSFVSTSADTVGKELYFWLYQPHQKASEAIDFEVYW